MKRLMFACLIAGLAAISADSLNAGGLRCRNNNDCAPADCNVTWVDKEVTTYRCETKTKVVPTVVNRVVTKCVAEEYKYTVMVPETTQVKRTITVNKCVTKEVPYTYNVCVPVTTQEKRTVTVNKCVTKEVPYTYTVCVPVTTQEKRTVTTYKCVPEVVTQKVACKTWVAAACDSCDDGCRKSCFRRCSSPAGQWVCEYKDVQVTVNKSVPVTQEVLVNVCKYENQQKQGTRLVSEVVAESKEVLVNVCRYETQQKQGTRCVVEMVPETREVLCNVTTCKPVEKVGTRNRLVCETAQETVNVTQCYTETVPVKSIVKVAVYTPAAPCAAPCK